MEPLLPPCSSPLYYSPSNNPPSPINEAWNSMWAQQTLHSICFNKFSYKIWVRSHIMSDKNTQWENHLLADTNSSVLDHQLQHTKSRGRTKDWNLMAYHILFEAKTFLTVEMEKMGKKLGNKREKKWNCRYGWLSNH